MLRKSLLYVVLLCVFVSAYSLDTNGVNTSTSQYDQKESQYFNQNSTSPLSYSSQLTEGLMNSKTPITEALNLLDQQDSLFNQLDNQFLMLQSQLDQSLISLKESELITSQLKSNLESSKQTIIELKENSSQLGERLYLDNMDLVSAYIELDESDELIKKLKKNNIVSYVLGITTATGGTLAIIGIINDNNILMISGLSTSALSFIIYLIRSY